MPHNLWHTKLGHVSDSRLCPLASKGVLGQVKCVTVDCQTCQLAKFHALPFNNSDSISKAHFDHVHPDIWGPSPNVTMGGSPYFVIFIDHFSPCLLYTSPSPRDGLLSRMPSSA